METKRLVLTIVLCVLIFVGYNFVAMKMGWLPEPSQQPAEKTQQAPETAKPAESGDPSSAETKLAAFVPTEGRLITVETPLYKAVFHSAGGILRSFSLKKFKVSLMENSPQVGIVSEAAAGQAPLGLLIDGLPTWAGTPWAFEGQDLVLDESGFGVLKFSTEINGMRVVRELAFSGTSYVIDEKVRLQSPESRSIKVAFTFGASSLASEKSPSTFAQLRYFVFGGEPPVPEESQYNPTRVAWFQDNSFSEEGSASSLSPGKLIQGKVSWMGVMNNYFMGAVSMSDASASAKGRFIDGIYHVLIGKTGVTVPAGGEAVEECSYFLGPKDAKQLEATPNHLDKALDYGFFSVIAKPLVYLLDFLYGYVHNYGVAIILMTVLIKAIFWPLSQKSYKSMQQMKQLQPLIAKIREKHADDKETMNREVMQLYKTYKVNPAGGCLPILVQIPVFFGLYQALLNAIELRHASFITYLPFTDKLWLADLSSPDPFLITPLVMGATMFLQQKMTPAAVDPTQAKVMMFMPVIFTVLFLGFPSGLVVYWLVNNVISIAQQQWQYSRKPSS